MKKDKQINKSFTNLEKDWKYYLGLVFLILSIIFPIIGLVFPFFDFPSKYSIPITTFLLIGIPEIMIIVAVSLLGKKYYQFCKQRFFKLFKKKFKPVSKKRYYFGLIIMVLSVFPLYLYGYGYELLPKDNYLRYFMLFLGDFCFVLSFFIMGKQFWHKCRCLFVWEDKSFD
jgi:hypothetical protein